jgi:ABC-type bacteriocin/lantibiotic exporter with double-glycine peptidase domain
VRFELVMTSLFSKEFRWLLREVRPYLRWHLGSLGLVTAGSLISLLDPLVVKWLIDSVLPKGNGRMLFAAVALIFFSYEGRIVFSLFGSYLTFLGSQKMVLSMRTRLLEHLDQISADYHEQTPTGSKQYLFASPLEEVSQIGSDVVPSILRLTLLAAAILGTMAYLNAPLTAVVLPLVPAFLVTRYHFRRRLHSAADDVQQQQMRSSAFLQEHLSSVIDVQLLTREKYQERMAFGHFADTFRAQYALWKTSAGFTLASGTITAVAITAILGYGGTQVLAEKLTVGGLVAFYSYLVRLFEPLSGAVELYARVQRLGASIRRIMEAFSLTPSVRQMNQPKALAGQRPLTMECQGVCFWYDKARPVLQDVHLRMAAGERIAIVGVNGSGKSTLAKLVARLYDPVSGHVHISGTDIREAKLQELRSLVFYAPQRSFLFGETLSEILRFGNPWATHEEIEEAIQLACLTDVLKKLPNGRGETLGRGGLRLSDGQRQRVAIARAILRKPRILLLDEATSFLDANSERHILEGLHRWLHDGILVVISHRLASISWVDRILVMDHGRIAEEGKHAALVGRSPFYTELVKVSAERELVGR